MPLLPAPLPQPCLAQQMQHREWWLRGRCIQARAAGLKMRTDALSWERAVPAGRTFEIESKALPPICMHLCLAHDKTEKNVSVFNLRHTTAVRIIQKKTHSQHRDLNVEPCSGSYRCSRQWLTCSKAPLMLLNKAASGGCKCFLSTAKPACNWGYCCFAAFMSTLCSSRPLSFPTRCYSCKSKLINVREAGASACEKTLPRKTAELYLRCAIAVTYEERPGKIPPGCGSRRVVGCLVVLPLLPEAPLLLALPTPPFPPLPPLLLVPLLPLIRLPSSSPSELSMSDESLLSLMLLPLWRLVLPCVIDHEASMR